MHMTKSIFTFNSVPFTCRMSHGDGKVLDLQETDAISKLGTGTCYYMTTNSFHILSNSLSIDHSINAICQVLRDN
jgi:hypothetical protein